MSDVIQKRAARKSRGKGKSENDSYHLKLRHERVARGLNGAPLALTTTVIVIQARDP